MVNSCCSAGLKPMELSRDKLVASKSWARTVLTAATAFQRTSMVGRAELKLVDPSFATKTVEEGPFWL